MYFIFSGYWKHCAMKKTECDTFEKAFTYAD
jgi:hypothetical protein